MPNIIQVYARFKDYIKGTSIIRLHGYNRENMEMNSKKVWNNIIDPKDTELIEIIKIVKELKNKNVNVFLNVNNHYEGSSPLTIQKIMNLIK